MDEKDRLDDAARDRGLGAFLGLAIGDALGTTLEFQPRDAKPAIVDMVGGGPFRLLPGVWTDDTSMALCLADSLIEQKCLDEHDLLDRFVRWLQKRRKQRNRKLFRRERHSLTTHANLVAAEACLAQGDGEGSQVTGLNTGVHSSPAQPE